MVQCFNTSVAALDWTARSSQRVESDGGQTVHHNECTKKQHVALIFHASSRTPSNVSALTRLSEASAPCSVVLKSVPRRMQDETGPWQARGRDKLHLHFAHGEITKTNLTFQGQWGVTVLEADAINVSRRYNHDLNTSTIEIEAANNSWVRLELVLAFDKHRQPLLQEEEDRYVIRARERFCLWLAGGPQPPATLADMEYSYGIRTKWVGDDRDAVQLLIDSSYVNGSLLPFAMTGDTSEVRNLLRSSLPRLAVAYAIHNTSLYPAKTLALQGAALRNFTIHVMRWASLRGVNGSNFYPGFKTETGDFWPDANGTPQQLFEWVC